MGFDINWINNVNSYISNEVDRIIIKNIHEDIIKRGIYPKFGSPETKCNKCMFYGISCGSKLGRVGCLSGWKMAEE